MAAGFSSDGFDAVFSRAASRAAADVARHRVWKDEARRILEEPGWQMRLAELPVHMRPVVLAEAIAQAWATRFGRADEHLARFLELRRLCAREYARSRLPAVRDAWFDAAARVGNAYRIAGLFREARRTLDRLASIEEYLGTERLDPGSIRQLQERAARRLGFLARLEWVLGNYPKALALTNREIVKRRLLVDSPGLALAYSHRALVRGDSALDLSGPERKQAFDRAKDDIRRCFEHAPDPSVAAAAVASLAIWAGRDGGPIDAFARYFDLIESRGEAIPAAIRLRLDWAQGLVLVADGRYDEGDRLLADCYQRLRALGRDTDAGIVVLDRIRLRFEAKKPLGVVQLLLRTQEDLRRSSLTPETLMLLDTLWLQVLHAVRSGMDTDIGPQLRAAHLALARE